jgi:BED zinc finger
MAPPRQGTLPFGRMTPADASENASQASQALLGSSFEVPSEPASQATSHSASESTTPRLPIKSKQKKQARTAWVFKFMRGTDEMQAVFKNANGKEEWRCRFCTQNYLTSGGTHAIKRHLLTQHDITEESTAETRAKNVQIAIESAITSASENPQKRRKLNDSTSGATLVNGDVLEVLYVRFIAACNLPLSLVSSPEFRALLSYLNEDIDRWLPSSGKTVRGWVMRQFDVEKAKIKNTLANAITSIHISCDIWTSPNNKPILGVVAHYIDEKGTLAKAVLSMKEVIGVHDGDNLAGVVMSVITEWEIQDKLGYFVMDNAPNNDTMMRQISLGKSFAFRTYNRCLYTKICYMSTA